MEPPLHPVIAAAAKANSKTAANAGGATGQRKRRAPTLLRASIEKKTRSSEKGQRIWKRLAGCRNRREGPKGITCDRIGGPVDHSYWAACNIGLVSHRIHGHCSGDTADIDRRRNGLRLPNGG